jgi:hypothetical protein
MKLSLLRITLFAALSGSLLATAPLAAPALSPAANPKNLPPLATITNGPITVRVLRAEWATAGKFEDGTVIQGSMGKGLVLWLDAQSNDPTIKPAEGLSLSDYIIGVSVVGPALPTRPVLAHSVDIVKSIHRSSLPYVLGSVPPGLSVWRFPDADPRWASFKFQVEYLLPGSPYTPRTLPRSPLLPVPPDAHQPDLQWQKRFEWTLSPASIGAGKAFPAGPIVATARSTAFEACLVSWTSSLIKVTVSKSGTNDSTPAPPRTDRLYSARVLFKPLRPLNDTTLLPMPSLDWEIIDDKVSKYTMGRMGDPNIKYWKVDGTPVGPDETMFEFYATTPAAGKLPHSITINSYPPGTGRRELGSVCPGIVIPKPGEGVTFEPLGARPAPLDPVRPSLLLRRVRSFDAANLLPGPLPANVTLPPSGLALLVKVTPSLPTSRIRFMRIIATDDTGHNLAPDGLPAVPVIEGNLLNPVESEAVASDTATGPGRWYTLILPSPSSEAKTLKVDLRVHDVIAESGPYLVTFKDLPVPEAAKSTASAG